MRLILLKCNGLMGEYIRKSINTRKSIWAFIAILITNEFFKINANTEDVYGTEFAA